MLSWIERGKKVIMNTYKQFPIVLERGNGTYLWDVNNKKYLDFVSGIAVNALGHAHEAYIKAISYQVQKLQHCSNLYWIMPAIELGEILIKNSCFDKVFFCNSGTESVEAAIKLSRKYGKKKKGKDCYEIITMKGSFHGRTFGSLSATGQIKYQKGFEPLLKGFQYCEFNNFEDVLEKVSKKTCAIMIEPIQGEGGINMADETFLRNIRKLCNEENIILIFDEVQCGMGRTGQLFAYQNFNVKPDIISLAKGLGGGFPIGAMMANQEKADAFEPGDHASTFGGNPLACEAAKVVLNELIEGNLLKNVNESGNYLIKKLNDLKKEFSFIEEIRGLGLLIGVEFEFETDEIINKCIDNGLLLVNAGKHVIRFLPPLSVKKEEIDEAIEIFSQVLKELKI